MTTEHYGASVNLPSAAEVIHTFIADEVGWDAGEPMLGQANDLLEALAAAGFRVVRDLSGLLNTGDALETFAAVKRVSFPSGVRYESEQAWRRVEAS